MSFRPRTWLFQDELRPGRIALATIANGAAVISFGHHDAAITRHEMIGMNEVGVQAVSSVRIPQARDDR